MYMYIYLHVFIFIHIWIYVYINMCIYIYIYIVPWPGTLGNWAFLALSSMTDTTSYIHLSIYIYTLIYLYVCVYIYVYIYVWTYTYIMYICIYTCTYVCTYTYGSMHMYIYTHHVFIANNPGLTQIAILSRYLITPPRFLGNSHRRVLCNIYLQPFSIAEIGDRSRWTASPAILRGTSPQTRNHSSSCSERVQGTFYKP